MVRGDPASAHLWGEYYKDGYVIYTQPPPGAYIAQVLYVPPIKFDIKTNPMYGRATDPNDPNLLSLAWWWDWCLKDPAESALLPDGTYLHAGIGYYKAKNFGQFTRRVVDGREAFIPGYDKVHWKLKKLFELLGYIGDVQFECADLIGRHVGVTVRPGIGRDGRPYIAEFKPIEDVLRIANAGGRSCG